MARTKQTRMMTSEEAEYVLNTGRFPPNGSRDRDVSSSGSSESRTKKSEQSVEPASPGRTEHPATNHEPEQAVVPEHTFQHVRLWEPRNPCEDTEDEHETGAGGVGAEDMGEDAEEVDDGATEDFDGLSVTSFCTTDGIVPYAAPSCQGAKFLPSPALSPCDNKGMPKSFMSVNFAPKVKRDDALCALIDTSTESDRLVMTTMLGALMARGDVLRSKVKIATKAEVTKGWAEWVRLTSDDKTSRAVIEKVGVVKALRISTRFHLSRNEEDLSFLLQRWSLTSHTFFASWGEFTLTLEDVRVILRLPLLEEFDFFSQSVPSFVADMATSLKDEVRKCNVWVPKSSKEVKFSRSRASYSRWIGYIFPGPPQESINPVTFTLGALLASGTALPLAPLYLGTLYSRLDQLSVLSVLSLGNHPGLWLSVLGCGSMVAGRCRCKKRAARYFMDGWKLFRRSLKGQPMRCISQTSKHAVMEEVHQGACGEHQGARKLYEELIKIGYYWPTMEADALAFVRRCLPCQKLANSIHAPAVELHALSTPWPFHTWAFDLIGPINPNSRGKMWILAATKLFLKWVEAVALKKANAESVATFIKENIICRFGLPKRILSDNGTPFINKVVSDLLAQFNIMHDKSSPYYPKGNGQAKATNKSLL
ncbi:Integrase, catalytic core [Senna tora]|uniref:Integrase, catalytic core n=1 Tax=Senna tora TaxID=362788 RepID=A0A834XBQ4_9FABA|nr:Integrase, catalytic core [Senna tora]